MLFGVEVQLESGFAIEIVCDNVWGIERIQEWFVCCEQYFVVFVVNGQALLACLGLDVLLYDKIACYEPRKVSVVIDDVGTYFVCQFFAIWTIYVSGNINLAYIRIIQNGLNVKSAEAKCIYVVKALLDVFFVDELRVVFSQDLGRKFNDQLIALIVRFNIQFVWFGHGE